MIDMSKTPTAAIAVIAAVSADIGLDIFSTAKKSFNIFRFKVFMQELRDMYPFEKICVILDHL